MTLIISSSWHLHGSIGHQVILTMAKLGWLDDEGQSSSTFVVCSQGGY